MWATLVKVRSASCVLCHGADGSDGVEMRVLAHVPTGGGRVREEVEVRGAAWRARVDHIRGAPNVGRVDVLESDADHARVRLDVASCPLQEAVAASGVLPRFPFEVKDGHDQWLLVSERVDAASFVDALRARGIGVEVLTSREHHPHGAMTARQRELMDAAVGQGYYEVPRRVTLTKLAERLKVSKSTLSETLARGERHVLEGLRDRAAP